MPDTVLSHRQMNNRETISLLRCCTGRQVIVRIARGGGRERKTVNLIQEGSEMHSKRQRPRFPSAVFSTELPLSPECPRSDCSLSCRLVISSKTPSSAAQGRLALLLYPFLPLISAFFKKLTPHFLFLQFKIILFDFLSVISSQ